MKRIILVLAIVTLFSCEKEEVQELCSCTSVIQSRNYNTSEPYKFVSSSPITLIKPKGGECKDNNSQTVTGTSGWLYLTTITCY